MLDREKGRAQENWFPSAALAVERAEKEAAEEEFLGQRRQHHDQQEKTPVFARFTFEGLHLFIEWSDGFRKEQVQAMLVTQADNSQEESDPDTGPDAFPRIIASSPRGQVSGIQSAVPSEMSERGPSVKRK